MSSLSDSRIIVTMLKCNGIYPGDPQVEAIFSYRNSFNGEETYKIIMNKGLQLPEFFTSPFCLDIKLLWDNTEGLTSEGRLLISKIDPDEDL